MATITIVLGPIVPRKQLAGCASKHKQAFRTRSQFSKQAFSAN